MLVDTFTVRAGADRLRTGWRCTRVDQDSDGVTVHFEDPKTGEPLPPQRGRVAIACDGIHSAVRKQMYPDEGTHRNSGINMWRGVTRSKPYLTGASIVRIGWFKPGKMVIYRIRNAIDAGGRQLINWVAEIETPKHERRDWNRAGRIEDFIASFEDWHFDWLDVPALIRNAETILAVMGIPGGGELVRQPEFHGGRLLRLRPHSVLETRGRLARLTSRRPRARGDDA